MIDLTDYGFTDPLQISFVDPGGVIDGALGGPPDIIDRPGLRYAIQFTTPVLSAQEARLFQSMLEQGLRDDVSYPWPLDEKVTTTGAPLVNGASPAGAVIPIKGLTPNAQIRQGQPLAIITGGVGSIHKAKTTTVADASGNMTLPVFPITRRAFLDGDTIELARPRIRGVLTWSGAQMATSTPRQFTFTITER